MTTSAERHLARLIEKAGGLIDSKYRRGQKEHGGKLWLKPGILDMAIDEAIDQVIYLLTLKEQMKNFGIVDPGLRE